MRLASARYRALWISTPTILAAAGALFAWAVPAAAQQPVSSHAERYEWNRWDTPAFTATLGLLAVLDYAAFDQDEVSKRQVGVQSDGFAWRAERFLVGGQLKFDRPWNYVIGANFNSFEADKPDRWSVLDLRVDIPVGESARLRIGREKVGVSQEWIMAGTDAQMMERSTVDLAFVPQRSNGVQITDNFAGQRGVWSVGAFNDWLTTGNGFSENGNQFTGRVGYLPVDQDEGATLLQVTGAFYYLEAKKGQLQFRARPEANQADYFIDTGKFDAGHALTSQLEFTAIRGPLMVVGNLSSTPVSAPQAGNPDFYGWYAGVSYALTGEHRQFNRRDHYYGALLPKSPFSLSGGGRGAWELLARYSMTDLTDGTLDGGRITRWTGGLSWVPSAPWRVEINYGYSTLERSRERGGTHAITARVQWYPF